MSTKHTPGPWVTKREGFSTVYVEARIGGGWIQEVAACGPTDAGREQQEANASLIAAAPDLLEALKDMHQVLSEAMTTGGWVPTPVQDSFRKAWLDMVAAIARATGEAS